MINSNGPELGDYQETISEEVMAFLRSPSEANAASHLDANDGTKLQLVAALDLLHRAVELIALCDERRAESEFEAQELERRTRELMQRTLEELNLQKARCQELEGHFSEADARAQGAERRAFRAEQRAAEAQARALAAEARAVEAETRSKQSECWRARLEDVLQELSAPLAATSLSRLNPGSAPQQDLR
jgi:hypothetical protein